MVDYVRYTYIPVLLCIILLPFIILSSVGLPLIFTTPAYDILLEKHHPLGNGRQIANDERETTDDATAKEITHELVAYFRTLEYTDSLLPSFNDRESQHLLDVKVLMHQLVALFIIALTIFIVALRYTPHVARTTHHARSTYRTSLSTILIYGGTLTFALLILCILIPFDSLFVHFHHLLFEGVTWQFPADSFILAVYPFGFFVDFALLIGVGASILALISIVVGAVLKSKWQVYHGRGSPLTKFV